MRTIWTTAAGMVVILAGLAGAVPPNEISAYRSLNVAGAAAPGTALLEISGDRGNPQPAEWVFLFADPSARGGVREIVVAGRELVSNRTPLRGFGGLASEPQIPREDLNVDSDKAFLIANSLAVTKRIPFHWAQYKLQMEEERGPVWTLRLIDKMGVPAGSVKISAKDGAIVSPLTTEGTNVERVDSTPPAPPVGGLIGGIRDLGTSVGRRVSDSALRTAGSVQEFLTGERTIGPDDSSDE